ncbi:MAG TPA: sugar phosphate isomerase/epimerase [Acidobacteriaceae bacterium]|jgi:sugar phosphate isomerase/epimerase|nr:sugar phosphate isomerase/epimerase [Acidobacteriaceae bacterium]
MKTAAACAVAAGAQKLWADPLGLPLGLQLYSVRELLPKDYDGTLEHLATIGYREVEAAGFYNHSAADVKQAMEKAGLRCVSAHYPLPQLKPAVDQTIDFARTLGLQYMICSSPMVRNQQKGASWVDALNAMSLDDWKWNAEQFNQIGEKVKAAGMQFGYHNHFFEFHEKDGVLPYDVLLHSTDPKLVTMEMDCGWVVVGGQKPEHYLTKYPERYSMLHIKEFKLSGWKPGTVPVSTELGRGSIDYGPIFAAAKKAPIRHIFNEQEGYPDMPAMQALKVDAEWLRSVQS